MVADTVGVHTSPFVSPSFNTVLRDHSWLKGQKTFKSFSVSHLGFLYLVSKERVKKKKNLSAVFGGCGACDVPRFFLLLVCCNRQHCSSLSLACNPVIYL